MLINNAKLRMDLMIYLLDLTNLSIISSKGFNFCNPSIVTLESIGQYSIWILFRYS